MLPRRKETVSLPCQNVKTILILPHSASLKNSKSIYVFYVQKHMQNALTLLHDRIMLLKMVLIESVNDELKNRCQIEHARHRSFYNLVVNLLSVPRKTKQWSI